MVDLLVEMQELSGVIFDIKKYSIQDGPGIRTTVFFKGCPLRCRWCHNPESQSTNLELLLRDNRCIHCEACQVVCTCNAIGDFLDDGCKPGMPPTDRNLCDLCGNCIDVCYSGARVWAGKVTTVSQVMREIQRDIPFYEQSGGGVTFSGGEPLMQAEFLHGLLIACKAENIHTVLDTCGYASWQTLKKIAPWVDLFLYDLKFMDDAQHKIYTGVSNAVIIDNLKQLSEDGHKIMVRVPVVPGITDQKENIRRIAEYLFGFPRPPIIELVPYHSSAEAKYQALGREYTLAGMISPTVEQLESVMEIFRSYGLSVSTYLSIHSAKQEVTHGG